MGFLYITATSILPKWFSKRRSLVLGIATSGAGVGVLAYNLGAGAGVESVGLPWTYRILAFCSLAMNLICSALLKDRKSPTSAKSGKAFDFRECARIQVILVVSWGFLTELGYITLLYSLPNYAISIGLSARQGSVIGAMLNMASVMTCTCGILCLALWVRLALWVPAITFPVLIAFALLSGSVTGTFWSCFAPITAEVVGMQRMPATLGMICFSLVLPTTFVKPIALQIVGSFGYLSSQVFVGCMFLGGAVCTFALRAWKIYEIEMKARSEMEMDQAQVQVQGAGGKDFWLAPRRLFMTRRV